MICYHYNNISWTEAWGLSFKDRINVVDQLKQISDEQRKALGKSKVLHANDLNPR